MRWQRGPLESGNFAKNGIFGENGDYTPKSPGCKQKFKWDGKGALWKVAIFAKMVYLVKMAEKVIKCQNRHTLNKYSNEMAKGPFRKWQIILAKMANLAKMVEMANNCQNHQILNKNSNDMTKGPFWKWWFWRKWHVWRKWREWWLIAKIPKFQTTIQMTWQRVPFERGELSNS